MNLHVNLLLVAITCILSTSQAFALSCRNTHIAPQLDLVLEQAMHFETAIKQVLATSKHPDEIQSAAYRLQKLEGLIEMILENPISGTLRAAVLEFNNLKQPMLEALPQVPTTAIQPKHQIVLLRKAAKDFENLQTYLKTKYQNFLKESAQANSLGELSASWALERIDVHEVTRGETYSIELNQAYRVVFTYSSNPKTITIHRISKRVTHD
ncbi:MAG: hypothetical protein ACXWC9_01110 [Pseudobdellovibrionaceae bacterium]